MQKLVQKFRENGIWSERIVGKENKFIGALI